MKNLKIFSVSTILILSFLFPSLAHEKPGSRRVKISARSVTKDVKVVIQVSVITPPVPLGFILTNNNSGISYRLDVKSAILGEVTTNGHNITFNSGDVFSLKLIILGLEFSYPYTCTTIPSDLTKTLPTFTYTLIVE